MGISVNGPSGIDTKTIIDSLVSIEQQKVAKIQSEKKAYQVKIDAYSKLKSFLSDIRTKANALGTASSFDIFKSTSSNDKAVTIKGGAGSVDGRYDVRVFQLATNEKMISTDNRLTSQTESLSSQGIGVGTISVDGVEIEIDADDTLQDLRSKINNATKTDGTKLDVSASVLKISDTNYRLVLNSKNSGSEGIQYRDVSGSTLQDLGIIADAAGNKGNVQQSIRSADDIASAFNSVAAGESITFTGADHNGNSIQSTFIKSADSTIDDFLAHVENSYFGTVDASVDGTGNLILTDKTAGTSKLAMTSFTTGTVSHTMSIATAGDEGAGVLSTGKDSYFSIDNIYMSNATNSVSGVVTGATFDFQSIAADTPVTLNLERDNDAIQKKFQEFIDVYNALLRFSKNATKYKNPDDETSKDGELAGDSTVMSIVSQIRSTIKGEFGLFGNEYTNLTMFGLKTDTNNGELQVDGDKFKKGLETHLDDLQNIFNKIGVSDNSSVTLGRSTAETTSGRYVLEEVDADHVRIRLENSTEWYTSDARSAEIVTFSDGPAKGLSLTAAAGSITGSATFTFSKGLSGLVDEIVNKMNDTTEGVVSMRQESWRKSISQKDDRIDKMNDRIEKYRERLTKQFTAMEQAMSDMQAQFSKFLGALGNNSN